MGDGGTSRDERRSINCDQTAHLIHALSRLASAVSLAGTYPRCSELGEVAITGAVFEIVDALGLCFEDSDAANNALMLVRKMATRHQRREEVNDG